MRYRVYDLPAVGVGAFTPTPTTNPTASSWGLVGVMGSPGTMPIPAPAPQRSWLPSLTRRGAPDTAQDSSVVPDVILPDLYEASTRHMGPAADAGIGMHARRLNPLPVPSWTYPRTAKVAQGRPRIGGRSVTAMPRAFQRYPIRTCPSPAEMVR